MINVILSGGAGTRLWPISRTKMPKQFVKMFDNESLFQKTYLRNQTLCDRSLIVSNIEQYFLAIDQLEQMPEQGNSDNSAASLDSIQFILESVGRNTAPAIAFACMAVEAEEVVLVTPSDHLIKNHKSYLKAVSQAKELAQQDYLVTFGIQPTSPETGYGYIHADELDVLEFKEKPTKEVAELYLAKGNYYWNSGMFCFKAGTYLEELEKYSPDIYQACRSIFTQLCDTKKIKISEEDMMNIPADSIDYAVMEHSKRVKVVQCDMTWSDLGSFESLFEELRSEEQEGATLAISDDAPIPITINAKNNLIITNDRLVTLIDVDDMVVVDTKDAILVSKLDSSQKVKEIVSVVKSQHKELSEIHQLVHRPWGTYEVLKGSPSYKVKRIIVKPGKKLSLQKHQHRSEHWVVVSGTATVTVDDNVFLIRPNESTYIQAGQLHRLENKGKIDLVMVEVQVGEYTGEDDIERFDDVYGR